MPTEVIFTSGSDGVFTTAFSEDETPVNLTGYTADIIDVYKAIRERLSPSITDPVNGEVTVLVEGSDPIPPGRYHLRVQVTSPSGQSMSTERIYIVVR
jgi:hypothetical protein